MKADEKSFQRRKVNHSTVWSGLWGHLVLSSTPCTFIYLIRSSMMHLTSAVILVSRPEPGRLAIKPVVWYTSETWDTTSQTAQPLLYSSILAMAGACKPWLNQHRIHCFCKLNTPPFLISTGTAMAMQTSLCLDGTTHPQLIVGTNAHTHRCWMSHKTL